MCIRDSYHAEDHEKDEGRRHGADDAVVVGSASGDGDAGADALLKALPGRIGILGDFGAFHFSIFK